MCNNQRTLYINLKLAEMFNKSIISIPHLNLRKNRQWPLLKIIVLLSTLQQSSVAQASDEGSSSHYSLKAHCSENLSDFDDMLKKRNLNVHENEAPELNESEEERGMILLDELDYNKVLDPLKQVTINKLFAIAVAERKVAGKIFVDDVKSPTTFYILHPYGMSLLLGNTENNKFNEKLYDYLVNNGNVRGKIEWLQVFPESWYNKIELMLGNNLIKKHDSLMVLAANNDEPSKVVENTRVNFTFDKERYEVLKKKLVYDDNYRIVRVDEKIYTEEVGSVVPKYFWDNVEKFLREGIGFSLLSCEKVASTAFSSFIIDQMLEIGIETNEQFRGKGLALIVSSHLIDYCLEHGYQPVWACRLENTASYKLAQKLGFIPEKYLPYYKLNKFPEKIG